MSLGVLATTSAIMCLVGGTAAYALSIMSLRGVSPVNQLKDHPSNVWIPAAAAFHFIATVLILFSSGGPAFPHTVLVTAWAVCMAGLYAMDRPASTPRSAVHWLAGSSCLWLAGSLWTLLSPAPPPGGGPALLGAGVLSWGAACCAAGLMIAFVLFSLSGESVQSGRIVRWKSFEGSECLFQSLPYKRTILVEAATLASSLRLVWSAYSALCTAGSASLFDNALDLACLGIMAAALLIRHRRPFYFVCTPAAPAPSKRWIAILVAGLLLAAAGTGARPARWLCYAAAVILIAREICLLAGRRPEKLLDDENAIPWLHFPNPHLDSKDLDTVFTMNDMSFREEESGRDCRVFTFGRDMLPLVRLAHVLIGVLIALYPLIVPAPAPLRFELNASATRRLSCRAAEGNILSPLPLAIEITPRSDGILVLARREGEEGTAAVPVLLKEGGCRFVKGWTFHLCRMGGRRVLEVSPSASALLFVALYLMVVMTFGTAFVLPYYRVVYSLEQIGEGRRVRLLVSVSGMTANPEKPARSLQQMLIVEHHSTG